MRLDDSPERHDALIQAWDACLVKHGARYLSNRDRTSAAAAAGQNGAVAARTVAEPIPKAARAACMNKLPLGPPEQDPDLNPNYREDTLANIKCLREHGIMVHLVRDTSDNPGGLTWTYDNNAGKLPSNQDVIEKDCELAAFGDKS